MTAAISPLGLREPRFGLARGADAFRLLVEAVTDYAIFLIDPDGVVLTWNRGAQRIKGYRADEIIGQNFSVFYTPREVRAGKPLKVLSEAARHGSYEDEGWRVRKDGSRFWADVVVTALKDRDGLITGFAKVTRDVTERRAAEQNERQLEVEQKSRAAAEEALRARDRFLSIASHELKTPVASLQLAIEALVRSHRRGLLDDQRLTNSLQRMERSIQRMASLVTELLDVSRLVAEAQFPMAPVDLGALVTEVVEQFEDVGQRERIDVDIDDSVVISGNEGRLVQVVANLLDNALKYSPDDARVSIRVGRSGRGASIEVADAGIGLDEELIGGEFDPFERGANASHVPGLGLGLYIARQIVEGHGGRLSARSDGPGHGSTFKVWLPKAAGRKA